MPVLEQLTIQVKVDDRLVPGVTRLIECADDVAKHCKNGDCLWLVGELATALNRIYELNGDQ